MKILDNVNSLENVNGFQIRAQGFLMRNELRVQCEYLDCQAADRGGLHDLPKNVLIWLLRPKMLQHNGHGYGVCAGVPRADTQQETASISKGDG